MILKRLGSRLVLLVQSMSIAPKAGNYVALPSSYHQVPRDPTRFPTLKPFDPLQRRNMTSAENSGAVDTEGHSAPAIAELSSPPVPDQIVRHEGKEYTTVKEGLAYILTPYSPPPPPQQQSRDKQQQQEGQKGQKGRKGKKSTEDVPQARQSVFYNPIQQFNRDLSVIAIRAYGEHVIASKKAKHARKLKEKNAEKEEGPQNKGIKRKRGEEEVEGDDEARAGKKANMGDDKTNDSVLPETNPGEVVTETSAQQRHTTKLEEWEPPFRVLDALSASGLRALRYAKELPFVSGVVANDLSSAAIDSMKLNVRHNGLGNVVHPHTGDACAVMYGAAGPHQPNKNGSYQGKFDVVDLDPYGTVAPFLDAAVQAVCNGGLICVTSTDAGVFASAGYPEKTFSLYGGLPVKGPHSHEGGLRLILHALASSASKYGLAIEPLLSLSIDFYARVFVRMHKTPAEVKFTAGKTMIVYSCDSGCGAWKTQSLAQTKQRQGKNGAMHYHHSLAQAPTASPNCEHCGFKTHLAGPMWAGPLHNPHFIQRILDMLPELDKETYPTVGRIEGMLVTALEEDLDLDTVIDDTPDSGDSMPETQQQQAPDATTAQLPSLLIPRVDISKLDPHPFFFLPSALSKVLHTETISEDMLRGALRNLGYRSTRSHAKPNSVRTDAPWEVIWEIMREWVRQKSPVAPDRLADGTAGAGIMRRRRTALGPGSTGAEAASGPSDAAGAGLRALKRDVLTAVESGRNLEDLRTKIEAALYRSSATRPDDTEPTPIGQTSGEGTADNANANTQAQASQDKASQASSTDPGTLNIVFDAALGQKAMAARRKRGLVRYQENPRANWGPLTRAPVSRP